MAKVSIPEPKKRKISPQTVDAIFIGYALDSNVNIFLVIKVDISEISNNTIIEVRDVVCFESIFPFKFRIPNDPSCTPYASVFFLLVLLLLLILNVEGAKEVGLLYLLVKTSSHILKKVILTPSKK